MRGETDRDREREREEMQLKESFNAEEERRSCKQESGELAVTPYLV